ncbi:lanthionine synthetase [Parafrankia colletiae]|uniref:Lanthionine synthetase n=1 Tax=Parafrankia colletiae TaxID=573497 RepID=A0A1S1QED9_9ACTN|nr:lanthionine synthetase C family protein [Parafrankia colletiae]MCK9904186.1 lanthionine synthetase C family protein [Frankia sp. Cpl3]OHV31595.1 lanthionine synthetase [Parafrankia colletiae]
MTTGQSLGDGAVGVALLHLETGNWPAVYAVLEQAVAGGVSVAETASLYYGAPAFAFVLAGTDRAGLARATATAAAGTATLTRRRLDAAHQRIDNHQRPPYAEYDLIRGLTGLGVALRRIGDLELLGDVLTYLVRLTDPIDGLPGWWCVHGPHRGQPVPGGHGNHGLAHGITGPLALLALTHLDGVHVTGHTEAITRIVRWLDSWQRRTGDGAAWWPQTLTRTDVARGEPTQAGPLRPSWCYGTPGIARAQQLAARALGDTTRQHHAETAFAACIADATQLSRLADRGLCHGTGGLLTAARRIAADALTPIPIGPLAHRHHHTMPAADEPSGFLDGSTGAALAAVGTTTCWDACLLLC